MLSHLGIEKILTPFYLYYIYMVKLLSKHRKTGMCHNTLEVMTDRGPVKVMGSPLEHG